MSMGAGQRRDRKVHAMRYRENEGTNQGVEVWRHDLSPCPIADLGQYPNAFGRHEPLNRCRQRK